MSGRILRRLATNTGIATIGRAAELVVIFLFSIYIARSVGPEQFGRFALVGVFVYYFGFLARAGLGPVTVREIARDPDEARRFLSHMISLRLLLGVIAYPLMIGVSHLLGYDGETLSLFYVFGLTLIAEALAGAVRTALMGREILSVPVTLDVLTSLTGAAVGGLLLASGHDLFTLMAGLTTVRFIMLGAWLGVAIRFRTGIRFRLDLEAWGRLLRQALPFTLISLMQQFNRGLSIFLLSVLPGPVNGMTASGHYAPASQVARFPIPLLSRTRMAIIPTVAANLDNHQVIRQAFEWATRLLFLLVSVPLAIAAWHFGGPVMELLFGPQYRDSAPLFALLGLAYALQAVLIPMISFISATRDISRLVPFVAIPVATNLALALWLIPTHGAWGAALAVLLSKMVNVVVVGWSFRTIFPVRPRWKNFSGTLAMGLGLFAAAGLVGSTIDSLAWQVVVSVALYLAVVGIWGRRALRRYRHLAQEVRRQKKGEEARNGLLGESAE
ncbi:MAG TPA: hypothetical protein ENK54_05310 [Thiotrichales bacterium]|nr:hypothetical protein [Thiotrichales bacterium]